MDAQIFNMMAQRIKADFHLTDEQLGFLLGPANIIFYVLVGIPLARLVDLYPRKYVLAGGITLIGGITAPWGTRAELRAAVHEPHAGRRRRLGTRAGLVLDAVGLLSAGETAAGHRLPAARLHRRQRARYLPRRVLAHPRGDVAGHSLDGPDDPRLAVGAHDGRCPGLCDRGPAAAGQGAAAARGDGALAGRADERRVA